MKAELTTAKEESVREIKKYKMKKDQLKQASKEKETRLQTELESKAVEAKLEKDRLFARLQEQEEQFDTEKANLINAREQAEILFKSEKDALRKQLQNLDQDSGPSESAVNLSNRAKLLEVELLTTSKKLENVQNVLEGKDAEMEKLKKSLQTKIDNLSAETVNLTGKLNDEKHISKEAQTNYSVSLFPFFSLCFFFSLFLFVFSFLSLFLVSHFFLFFTFHFFSVLSLFSFCISLFHFPLFLSYCFFFSLFSFLSFLFS